MGARTAEKIETGTRSQDKLIDREDRPTGNIKKKSVKDDHKVQTIMNK